MGIVRFTVTVVLVAALCVSSLFASGFENSGIGVYGRGMGGAFRAIANDWTAAYYNPAGYAFIMDNQLGGTVGLFNNRYALTPDYYFRDDYGNEYATGMINGYELFNRHEVRDRPAVGFVVRLPLAGETVFGLSAYEPFDYSLSWKLYDPSLANFRAYNDGISASLPLDEFMSDIDVVAFQLTAAREYIPEKLSVGLGLQVLRADVVYNDIVLRENPRQGVLSARPRDYIPESTRNSGYGFGFGVTGGLLWKPDHKTSIGLNFRVPFDVTIDGNATLDYYLPSNDKIAVLPGELNTIDNLFVSGEIISINADMKTKLRLPPSIGGGIAYDVSEKLKVAVDAEFTFWSRFEGFDFDYTALDYKRNIFVDSSINFFGANLNRPAKWSDAGKVAAGLNYKATGYLSLLAGFSFDQSPLRDSDVRTPQFVDTGDKMGYNGGFVFHVDRWDLGLMTSYFDYPDQSAGMFDSNGDGLIDSFPGDYKAETYETVLSFNYRF